MEKSKVYFTNFRTAANGDSVPIKLKGLIKEAGIADLDLEGKFVAIKMHFGEMGNLGFLRPNFAKAVVDVVYELGGKPYLVDCNTLYPGSRKNGIDHLFCAWENGFSPLSVGCPIFIGDGIKGLDDAELPVIGGTETDVAYIGRAVADADVVISLNHFKGHEMTGFGGALKNLGMGCGSRRGKKFMHSSSKAEIDESLCRGCKRCQKVCANNGLVYDESKKKMTIDEKHCAGCGRCIAACSFDAISFANSNSSDVLKRRIVEYAKAVCGIGPNFHINVAMDITPDCDCHCQSDVPIIPDVRMFASKDPVAIDSACMDACRDLKPVAASELAEKMRAPGFVDRKDPFTNARPLSSWYQQLEHGEEIGLGSKEYELIELDLAK